MFGQGLQALYRLITVSAVQAIDFVEPGRVDWKRVNKPKKDKPLIRFKRGENCKYAVQLGKDLGFSLVGVGGNDILDGNKKLILGTIHVWPGVPVVASLIVSFAFAALLWQLMRHHVLVMLRELGGGKAVSEKQIRAWANETAEGAGSSIHIHSFKVADVCALRCVCVTSSLFRILAGCQAQGQPLPTASRGCH